MATGTSLSLRLFARKRNERSAKPAKQLPAMEPLVVQPTRRRSAAAKEKMAATKPSANKLMLRSPLRSRKSTSIGKLFSCKGLSVHTAFCVR